MTHTLHRKGTHTELEEDFVVLACLAKDYNRESTQARENLIKVAEILKKYNPTNMIPNFTWKISPVITAVYDNREIVKKIVKKLKREDLGISIVISGLIKEVKELLNQVDLKMHTVHLSLGVFGKKELLPKDETILEATTMCGHHCVSPQSIEYYIKLIKDQKISIEKAAEKLAKPCVCGIFNIERAINIIRKILNKK